MFKPIFSVFLAVFILLPGCISETRESQPSSALPDAQPEMTPTTSTLNAVPPSSVSPRLRVYGKAGVGADTATFGGNATKVSSNPKPADYADKALFHNGSAYGFGITYPGNWRPVEGTSGVVVAFMSPLEGALDDFSENLNVAAAPYDKRMTLGEFKADTGKNFGKIASDYAQLDVSEVIVNGNSALKHVYMFKQGDISLKGVQFIIYSDSRVYVLTCTARAETYDRYLPSFEEMVYSFETSK